MEFPIHLFRILRPFCLPVLISYILLHYEVRADDRFLFIFGGFPDVRHLGGGVISSHGTANPATLELTRKYDINISIGLASSEPSKQTYVRISDSITSKLGGAIGFKCISTEFICSGNNSKILEGDLSYGFPVSNILVGLGIGIKAKLDNQLQDKLGPKNIFFGPGFIASGEIRNEVNFLTGGSIFSNSYNIKRIYGGFGIGILTHDIFVSAQLFIVEKVIPSGGVIVRALEWFRILVGYSGGAVAGLGFISPKLYIWGGYSFKKIGMVSIGLAL